MTFDKRVDSALLKADHVSYIAHDTLPVDIRVGISDEASDEGLLYYFRVKPDRRRAKAAYPPHLDRRPR